MLQITAGRFRELAREALLQAGASTAMATSLVDATISAERAGRSEVGASHLLDYIAGLREGRIDGKALPQTSNPLPAFIAVDANEGIAQLGFDLTFPDVVERAHRFGLAVFIQRNSYTAGELGYYVRRLAEAGLISIAATNAHAMMALSEGGKAVFSTNPLAFGAPLPEPESPLVIDQASSATAFVKLKQAAAEGAPIPQGWAVDQSGSSTTDAAEALLGAMLPFGGYKGGNVALMVETLSAGLTEANWSLDAGSFRSGNRSPGVGLTVVALNPPDAEAFTKRVGDFCRRLTDLGVHIPGSRSPRGPYADDDILQIDARILDRLTHSLRAQ